MTKNTSTIASTFTKETVVNAIAKYYAATLETMSKIYVHEKYDVNNNDQDLKSKIAFKGCDVSREYLTETEWNVIDSLTKKCGNAWKMNPFALTPRIEGNADGAKTFDQYLSEKRKEASDTERALAPVTAIARCTGERLYGTLRK